MIRTILEQLDDLKDSAQTAVICAGKTYTYRELIRCAKQVARGLKQAGVKKGDRVLFRMNRCREMVPALLGILYAGGVFVAGDMRWPEQRIADVISDAGCSLTMSDELCRTLLARTPADIELPSVCAEDEAAIYYTSGSTGVPKGTVLIHKVLRTRAFFENSEDWPAFHTVLCSANTTYILFLVDLCFAVNNSAAFLIASEEELASAEKLSALMLRYGADFVRFTPTVLQRRLADPSFAQAFRKVKYVGLTGEAIREDVADQIVDATDGYVLLGYGCTEVFRCTLYAYQKERGILLGIPGEGVRIFLFDEEGHPVRRGQEGELFIGGAGAEGGYYLNRPDLNAEKYVIHPEYGRLFRTGDYALLRDDGEIVLIGRKDNMIKLNGQRIEKGEIEAAMEAFPGIAHAAAAIQKVKGRTILCGYYTSEEAVDEASLRDAMCRRLPFYMCPQLFLRLDKIPVNENGKRLYRDLPEPEVLEEDYLPPETETEEMLCSFFSRVLHVPRVGVSDSFFSLGGDSISGMLFTSMLAEQGIDLNLSVLFRYPSVRELSRHLPPRREEAEEKEREVSVLPAELQRAAEEAVLPEEAEAFYPVTRHMKSRFQSRGAFYPIALFWEIDSSVSEEHLKKRIMELSEKHDALRSKLLPVSGGGLVQAVLKQARTVFFRVDLRALSKNETLSAGQKKYLSSLARMEISPETELGETVFFRLGLIRISKQRSVLYCGFSHYFLDGAGITRILTELLNPEPILPDRKLWQQRLSRLYRQDRREAFTYWEPFFEKLKAAASFPKSCGNGGKKNYYMAAGRRMYEKLKTFSSKREITMSVLMTYAIGRSLMKLQKSSSVIFYTMGTGRSAAEMKLPGMFTVSFPVVLSREDTPEDLQKQLIESDSNAWIFALPEISLPVREDLVRINVQNVADPNGAVSIPVTEFDDAVSDPERSLQNRYLAVADTSLEIQAYPDKRFAFWGWCDTGQFEAASLESLMRGAITELKLLVTENHTDGNQK